MRWRRAEVQLRGARPEPYAAGPAVQLDSGSAPNGRCNVALRTQIRIEPRRRRYTSLEESERLSDLFGEPARWGETLNPLQLATVATMVPGFTGSTTVPLVVPLTYDLDIASTKYLHGLDGGDVPLLLLFSGTVFTGAADRVQLELVPWHEEAAFRLPVAVWRAAMDAHFPDAAGCGCAGDAGGAAGLPVGTGAADVGRHGGALLKEARP